MPTAIPSRLPALALLLAALLGGCTDAGDCRTGNCSADERLAAEVLARINAMPALKADVLRVQAFDGTVYLYGIVETTREYYEVENIARQTPKVVKVVNMTAMPNNY